MHNTEISFEILAQINRHTKMKIILFLIIIIIIIIIIIMYNVSTFLARHPFGHYSYSPDTLCLSPNEI